MQCRWPCPWCCPKIQNQCYHWANPLVRPEFLCILWHTFLGLILCFHVTDVFLVRCIVISHASYRHHIIYCCLVFQSIKRICDMISYIQLDHIPVFLAPVPLGSFEHACCWAISQIFQFYHFLAAIHQNIDDVGKDICVILQDFFGLVWTALFLCSHNP